MCRWLAYYGDPLPIEALLLKRQHSLFDQSMHSREGATTTEARAIVSEPLGDVIGAWNKVPESTIGIVLPGQAGRALRVHPSPSRKRCSPKERVSLRPS